MKETHVELLRCLVCSGALTVAGVARRDVGTPASAGSGQIQDGTLACSDCNHRYPVLDGVGIFFDDAVAAGYLSADERARCVALGIEYPVTETPAGGRAAKAQRSAENWAYQWGDVARWSAADFEKDDFRGLKAFQNFIPIPLESYRGRRVGIWAGGSGREAFHVSKAGPSLLVVNDIGRELAGVRAIVGPDCELLLIRCDLLRNPLRPGSLDVSICDHALQHVTDWRAGFRALVAALDAGGTVAICVYSHENNVLMTGLVEPSKTLLHRLPLGALRAAAFAPALALVGVTRGIYKPASRLLPDRVARGLPLFEHLLFWSTCDLDFLAMSCFDLMHAPISHHFRKAEVEGLARDEGLIVKALTHTNGTLWTLVGSKPSRD